MTMSRGSFFFFFLSLLIKLKTTDICLGSTKMEISTGKKSISHWEKIRKSEFGPPPPPPKNIALMHLGKKYT